jgi:signal transduction histidine kinase
MDGWVALQAECGLPLSSPHNIPAHECADKVAIRSLRRDLHDVVGAELAGMATQLELVERLTSTDQEKAREVVAELSSEITDLIRIVRRMARGDRTDCRVPNIEAALRTMTSRMNMAVSPRLTFTLDYDPAVGSVPVDTSSAAFWIVREAITNVLKHSHAEHCTISLSVSSRRLRVRVEDDGPAGERPSSGGVGLTNMAERAAKRGGWCRGSRLTPNGFAVVASLPVA